MHTDFNELLESEDEPGFTPARRAELEADPETARALAGLRRRRAVLRGLPQLTPADDAWARTLARHKAGRQPVRAYGRYASVAAGLAAVATASLLLPQFDLPEPAGLGGATATMDVSVAPSVPQINEKAPATARAPVRVNPPTPGSGVPNTYESYRYDVNLEKLLVESRRLEGLLRAAPGREAMGADVAARMAELEGRLAVIDEGLNQAGVGAMDARYTEPLLRQRVEVMDQLLRVRYDGAGVASY